MNCSDDGTGNMILEIMRKTMQDILLSLWQWHWDLFKQNSYIPLLQLIKFNG